MPSDYSAERFEPEVPACRASKLSLHFTGAALVLKGGRLSHEYPAVSGEAGKYDPVPKGTYWISPQEVWEHTWVTDLKLGLVSLLDKRISSDAHRASWGNYRITIHPYPGTDTGGRGGFFIHGGKVPGSAGCIDLTHHMDAFVRDLRAELAGQEDCYIQLFVSS